MREQDNGTIIGLSIIAIVIGIVGGCSFGAYIERVYYRGSAIKQGHAEYDQETGEWQWKKKVSDR